MKQREIDLASLMFELPPLGDEQLHGEALSAMRKRYVETLVKHSMLYHFDEQVEDIAWNCEEPNSTEAQILNSLTANLCR